MTGKLRRPHSMFTPKPISVVAQRVGKLKCHGVQDQFTLMAHTLAVIQASDTLFFRGAHGRESYANDSLNSIVHTKDALITANSVYYNDERDHGGRTATERLEDMARAEKLDYPQTSCHIRMGGSSALEADRQAELRRSFLLKKQKNSICRKNNPPAP